MKEIKAVTGPQRLASLYEALRAQAGFHGMTVSPAEGYLSAHAPGAPSSIRDELTDHRARVRIEMVVSDDDAPRLYDCVVASLSSGQPGDSAVWMTEVARAAFVHKTV